MNRIVKHLFSLAIPLSFASFASAAIDYRYATDVSALTLSPGQTQTVNLYLQETATAPSSSRLVAEDGLSSASVQVAYIAPPSPLSSHSTIDAVAANTLDFNDPAGPDLPSPVNPDSAYIREYVDIAQPTGPTGTLAGDTRTIFLGSVTVRAGLSAGTTTFQVGDIPGTDDTVTITNFASPLDPLIASTSFTVTVIPEPASLAAGLLPLLPALLRRRSR